MAVPVIQSSNTQTGSSASSITITKPTGLAEGNLLLAVLAMNDTGDTGASWSTPSGWTAVTNSTIGDSTKLVRTAIFSKIATAGDVSASNFTFSASGSVAFLSGYLARITGHPATTPVRYSESDDDGALGGTTPVYTTAYSADTEDVLIVMNFAGADPNPGVDTAGSFASTPTQTWSTLAGIGVSGASNGLIHGVAGASPTGALTTFTSRQATYSVSVGDSASSIVFIPGLVNTSGTNAFLEVSPTIFSQAGRGDTNGTSALHEASTEVFIQSGQATSPTQWSNESKNTTTWTNESKS